MKATGFDIHAEITNRIVEAIEKGAGTFQMPWHVEASTRAPSNALTKRAYRGVNVLSLWITAQAFGYQSAEWATFKQWQEQGCSVRKGERGTPIVFYKSLSIEGEASDGSEDSERKIPFARASWVFNAAQVEGAEMPPAVIPEAAPLFDRLQHVEHVVAATGADISHGGARAFYQRREDRIQMPDIALFTGTETSTPQEAYYSTMLHELAHWTGAEHRLNREKGKRFADKAYAFEEIIAELTAAFLCVDLGITTSPRIDHAQYIAEYLEILRNDKRAIFTAAAAAQAAAEFIKATKHA